MSTKLIRGWFAVQVQEGIADRLKCVNGSGAQQ